MQWDIQTSGQTTLHTGRVEDRDWHAVVNQLAQFWEHFVSLISTTSKLESWDRVIIELCIDSGRIIAYPAMGGNRDPDITVQVVLALVLDLRDNLPNPDLDASDFEVQASQLELRMSNALVRSSLRNPAKSALTSVRSLKSPFTIFVQSSEEIETRRPTTI